MVHQNYALEAIKSNTPSTKFTSYRKFVSSGKSDNLRQKLLKLLYEADRPLTTNELAERLKTVSSNITQPLLSLRKSGLVVSAGRIQNVKTGLPNKAYTLADNVDPRS